MLFNSRWRTVADPPLWVVPEHKNTPANQLLNNFSYHAGANSTAAFTNRKT
jgi:hypothetical protein